MAQRIKTLRDMVLVTTEAKGKAAVYRALSAHLRTRYLPRDAAKAQAQLSCDGAPVSEALVGEVVEELESMAAAMVHDAELMLNTELSDAE